MSPTANSICWARFSPGGSPPLSADCVEKLRNQSVADFLRKPMKRNSRKALTTRQRMAARERM
ncbi:MAG: hypothetical protein GKR99_15315 [Rhodobacteraceae bacterium]|nr:hypothetical protein [Paracoccaceae bacterium]